MAKVLSKREREKKSKKDTLLKDEFNTILQIHKHTHTQFSIK